jgi:hypothetical protein
VATLTTALPILLVISYLTKRPIVLLAALPAFAIYFFLAERLLEDVARLGLRLLEVGDRLLNFVDRFDDEYDDEDEESLDFPDEHLLYVWGLTNSINREISSNKFNIHIVVVDEGFPVEIYP